MEFQFDPFSPLGLSAKVKPQLPTMVQSTYNRNLFYTKAEVDAKIAAGGGGGGAVASVNGYTGVVVLVKADLGLGNVDNTSDVNKPISTATQTALDTKVDKNASITGATKTKITYDSKGLVTGGSDATTADIADSSNKRYVTDAQLVVIGNTSGVNTGDQDLSGYVPTTRTVNGHALSANVTVSKSDVGLGSVTNDAQLKAADLDTDGTLAANSDSKVASQKAVKTYADTKQPLDADLTAIAALTPSGTTFIVGSGNSGSGQWTMQNVLQVRASLLTYQTFVYNSTGINRGNRFNSWVALMAAVAVQDGFRVIILERDETVPAGSYNLDYVTIQGNNGLEYNAGGWTLTFGDNTTISSWIGCTIRAVRLLSTSTTGNICTFSIPSLISNNDVSNVHSTTYPFFKFTGSGQMIVSLNNSARWGKLGGGVENLDVTSSAFACQLIVVRGKGSTIENNTLKSTNAVIFIDVLQDAGQDPTTYTLTNTGLTVGVLVAVNAVYATTINHTPISKTSTFTANRAAELYLCDATSGAMTANLPAATGSGLMFTFIKTDSSGNAVTIDGSGTETINGATTKVLSAQYDKATIIDAASGVWYIV